MIKKTQNFTGDENSVMDFFTGHFFTGHHILQIHSTFMFGEANKRGRSDEDNDSESSKSRRTGSVSEGLVLAGTKTPAAGRMTVRLESAQQQTFDAVLVNEGVPCNLLTEMLAIDPGMA